MKLLKKIFGIVLVTLLLVISVPALALADGSSYGSGSGGFGGYGAGPGGFNGYGTGTGGFNPYGVGTGGFNPYGTTAGGFNGYGTVPGGFNGYGGPETGTYTPTPTGTPTSTDPTGPTGGPGTGPGPIDDGPTWATLSDQVIPENSPSGTIVYPGLRNLCFDDEAVNMQVITTSPNFDVGFVGDNLILNSLVANWNGQELVGLDCNGEQNSFVLIVSPVNDAPTFTTSPVTTATVNSAYTYNADAVDTENDPFTFALITSPIGMSLDTNTGVVSWTPSSSQTGSHTIRLRVTDNGGAFSEQAYIVTVGTGGSGGSGGGGGGGGGSSNRHHVAIERTSAGKSSFVCGETVDLEVGVSNFGRFTENVNVQMRSDDLGFLQSLNRNLKRRISDDFNFSVTLPEGIPNGFYTFVTKMSYKHGEDYDYKTITVTCDQEEVVPEVITTTEDEPEEERSIWMLVTLILSVLAGVALLVWFVLLLRDELSTTERFI